MRFAVLALLIAALCAGCSARPGSPDAATGLESDIEAILGSERVTSVADESGGASAKVVVELQGDKAELEPFGLLGALLKAHPDSSEFAVEYRTTSASPTVYVWNPADRIVRVGPERGAGGLPSGSVASGVDTETLEAVAAGTRPEPEFTGMY